MTFQFKGTFNKSQYDRLAAFLRSQVQYCERRIKHLRAAKVRVGSLVMRFSQQDNTPIGYVVDSKQSRLGQLVAAYEVLGGNPFYDLQIRSLSDPVFLLKGSPNDAANMYSNGEPVPTGVLADARSARLMESATKWAYGTLDRQRHSLEHKIRRTVDYSDQLGREISLLQTIMSTAQQEGSLEDTLTRIEELFSDKRYRAIYDDGKEDPYGKLTYAPFAEYEPGPGRATTSTGYERGENGILKPTKVPE